MAKEGLLTHRPYIPSVPADYRLSTIFFKVFTILVGLFGSVRFKHYFKMNHSSIWDPLLFAQMGPGTHEQAIQPEKPYCNLINSGCTRYASFLDCPATPLAVRRSGYQLSRLAFLGFDSVLRLPMAITRSSDVFSNFPLLKQPGQR